MECQFALDTRIVLRVGLQEVNEAGAYVMEAGFRVVALLSSAVAW